MYINYLFRTSYHNSGQANNQRAFGSKSKSPHITGAVSLLVVQFSHPTGRIYSSTGEIVQMVVLNLAIQTVIR